MDLEDGNKGSLKVVRFRFLGVEGLHGECAAGDGKNGTTPKVGRELRSIEGGRCADEFEIGSSLAGL